MQQRSVELIDIVLFHWQTKGQGGACISDARKNHQGSDFLAADGDRTRSAVVETAEPNVRWTGFSRASGSRLSNI